MTTKDVKVDDLTKPIHQFDNSAGSETVEVPNLYDPNEPGIDVNVWNKFGVYLGSGSINV